MSTRYVWNRSNFSVQKTGEAGYSSYDITVNCLDEDVFWSHTNAGNYHEITNGPIYFIYGSGYTIANGGIQITGAALTSIPNGTRGSSTRFNLVVIPDTDIGAHSYDVDWYIGISKNSSLTQGFTHVYRITGHLDNDTLTIHSIRGMCIYNATSTTFLCADVDSVGVVDVSRTSSTGIYSLAKGTANGIVSNAASSTYPPQNYASKSARMCP